MKFRGRLLAGRRAAIRASLAFGRGTGEGFWSVHGCSGDIDGGFRSVHGCSGDIGGGFRSVHGCSGDIGGGSRSVHGCSGDIR